MISIKSIKNFITLNFFLICLSYFEFILLSMYKNVVYVFLIFLLRNILVQNGIDLILSKKNFIGNIDRINIKHNYVKIILFYLTSTLVETLTHKLIISFYIFKKTDILIDLMYFIPVSFIYEIIFDFFHYIVHRLEHNNSKLYKHIHKIHHTHQFSTSITTFYHHPFDLLISNTLPQILTLLILTKISYFMYVLIIFYKVFLEISGHTGKEFNSSSFPQFIWLPKILGIQLKTIDHDNHHKINSCNYSKRFTLWDKIFGTYKKY